MNHKSSGISHKRQPTNIRERFWRQQGFELIAGVDEVGVGAWAGPMVVAACILKYPRRLAGVRDSKELTAKKRAELYEKILSNSLTYAVAFVSSKIIDHRGLSVANHLAVNLAISRLNPRPDFILLDGRFTHGLKQSAEAIIDGDAKEVVIAAASIIAKVTRDRWMIKLARACPYYGFERHKGYGTEFHQHQLQKHGVSQWHRDSYAPIKKLILAANRDYLTAHPSRRPVRAFGRAY